MIKGFNIRFNPPQNSAKYTRWPAINASKNFVRPKSMEKWPFFFRKYWIFEGFATMLS